MSHHPSKYPILKKMQIELNMCFLDHQSPLNKWKLRWIWRRSKSTVLRWVACETSKTIGLRPSIHVFEVELKGLEYSCRDKDRRTFWSSWKHDINKTKVCVESIYLSIHTVQVNIQEITHRGVTRYKSRDMIIFIQHI